MSSRYIDDTNLYLESSKIANIEPDSYFARILPSSTSPPEKVEKDLKATIQSLSNEDLRDTVLQFLRSDGLSEKFLRFIEQVSLNLQSNN